MRRGVLQPLGVLALIVLLSSSQIYAVNFVPFTNTTNAYGDVTDAASIATAIANVPLNVGLVYDANGQTNNTQIYNYQTNIYTGVVDVKATLDRIRNNQSIFSTEPDDGQFFNFNGGGLTNIPRMGTNYYMEFMVWPYMDLVQGTYDTNALAYGVMGYPGTMRLLIGLGGEVYFSGDHYGEAGPQQNAYYVNPVPEPSGFLLLGGGLAVVAATIHRRYRKH